MAGWPVQDPRQPPGSVQSGRGDPPTSLVPPACLSAGPKKAHYRVTSWTPISCCPQTAQTPGPLLGEGQEDRTNSMPPNKPSRH